VASRLLESSASHDIFATSTIEFLIDERSVQALLTRSKRCEFNGPRWRAEANSALTTTGVFDATQKKVAVVTGGAAGIGRAISRFFAREGAHLAIADIDAPNGTCTSDEINSMGGKSSFILADVSKTQDVQEMVKTVAERYGGIDIAVNSAAIQMHGLDAPAHLLTEEVWDQTMNVNLRGVWLCSKFVIPAMLKRGGGHHSLGLTHRDYGLGSHIFSL
jgi:NAD(P)-dependent dehydrogenase (short-subunit alcohol dehydrogenase family)